MKIDTTKAVKLGIPFMLFVVGLLITFAVGIFHSGALGFLIFLATFVLTGGLIFILEQVIQ